MSGPGSSLDSSHTSNQVDSMLRRLGSCQEPSAVVRNVIHRVAYSEVVVRIHLGRQALGGGEARELQADRLHMIHDGCLDKS
eukprot:7302229-Pyramimonas_sp.AAC.1